jgi:hypothetical protein
MDTPPTPAEMTPLQLSKWKSLLTSLIGPRVLGPTLADLYAAGNRLVPARNLLSVPCRQCIDMLQTRFVGGSNLFA